MKCRRAQNALECGGLMPIFTSLQHELPRNNRRSERPARTPAFVRNGGAPPCGEACCRNAGMQNRNRQMCQWL
jgi:hypothetical protein